MGILRYTRVYIGVHGYTRVYMGIRKGYFALATYGRVALISHPGQSFPLSLLGPFPSVGLTLTWYMG